MSSEDDLILLALAVSGTCKFDGSCFYKDTANNCRYFERCKDKEPMVDEEE